MFDLSSLSGRPTDYKKLIIQELIRGNTGAPATPLGNVARIASMGLGGLIAGEQEQEQKH
jgi:hypothetical protein